MKWILIRIFIIFWTIYSIKTYKILYTSEVNPEPTAIPEEFTKMFESQFGKLSRELYPILKGNVEKENKFLDEIINNYNRNSKKLK